MNCRIFPRLAVSRILLATTLVIVCLPLSRVQLFAQESGSEPATVGQETPSSNPNSGKAPSSNPNKAVSSTMSNQSAPTEETLPVNIETGEALRTVISPLRWGHLSLLSVSLLEGYDSNFLSAPQPVAGADTFLSGLLVYSIRRGRSNLDLQYQPSVWYAQGTTHSDFSGHLVSFTSSTKLGPSWRLFFGDRFQYLPANTPLGGSSFTPDFAAGNAQSSPFLAKGHNTLANDFTFNIDHTLSSRSHLLFSFDQEFVRQTASTSSPGTSIAEDRPIFGGTVQWSQSFARNAVSASYGFQRYYYNGFGPSSDTQYVQLGYTRELRRSLTLSLQGGPSWTTAAPQAPGGFTSRQTTAQGFVTLFQAFRHGGVALSASRDNTFVGLLNNGYHNRYDASFTGRLFRRWDGILGVSYIQAQQSSSVGKTLGRTAWCSLGYRLSPSWSIFSTYNYYSTSGAGTLFPPRHAVSIGIRWAWRSEKDRR